MSVRSGNSADSNRAPKSRRVMSGLADTGNISFLRAAFYGRSNSPCSREASDAVARQYRLCRALCDGRAMIVRYFYDVPAAVVSADSHQLTPAFSGPPEHHGGWQDLTRFLSAQGRDFDVFVCSSLDRISRRVSEVEEAARHLARHHVPLICASGGWQETTPAVWALTSGIIAVPGRAKSSTRRILRTAKRPDDGR